MTDKQRQYYERARKLTDLDVKAIKVLYNTGKYSQRTLAKKYGICLRTLQQVLNGRTYKNKKGD